MVQALLLLLIHHLVDVCTDCVCGDGLKRTYSQAWFSRIYIEVVSDDPSDELGIVEERTAVAEALDASRSQIVTDQATRKAGPDGPASRTSLIGNHVRNSIKNPLVEQRGLEPRTPCLQSRCSSQLSYCPINIFYSKTWLLLLNFIEIIYFIKTSLDWWAMGDSNLRPRHYQ